MFFGNYTLRYAKSVTAVSRFTTTFSEFKKYKDQIVIIHNGIDLARYKPTDEPSIYRPFISNEKERSIVCLSLGRIEWLKGFQLFIKIIPELLKLNLNIKYFIAGRDNSYKKTLEQLIEKENLQNHVFFLGQLEFKEKMNALQNCDLVIVPSLVENFPIVPLEAMAMGKVIIANNSGGTGELINGNNGILTEILNQSVVVKEIKEVTKNENLKVVLKKNAVETIKRFNWIHISKKYVSIFITGRGF
jgi:glycosyltransferase involved in cell wall biosynthesis